MKLLMRCRYHVPTRDTKSVEELNEWNKLVTRPIQLRVCKILKAFIDNHFDDMDSNTLYLLKVFIRGMLSESSQTDVLAKALKVSFVKKVSGKHVEIR
jgi:hypothetical protein